MNRSMVTSLGPLLLLGAWAAGCAEESSAATRADPAPRDEGPAAGDVPGQETADEDPSPAEPGAGRRRPPVPEPESVANHERESDERPYVGGLVRGLVRGYDFADGRIELDSDGKRIALRAHPADARGLTPGEAAALRYANFGGRLWVVADAPPWLEAGSFTRSGTIRAPIQVLDLGAGVLVVGGQRLRAHPLQLSAVVPGAFVEATHVRIGAQEWLADITPRSDAGRTWAQQRLPEAAGAFLSGAVLDRDTRRGRIRVRSDGERVEVLRASPTDIHDLEKGDAVALPRVDYAGTPWLELQRDAAAAFHPFDRRGQVTGAVTYVDGSNGRLVLRGHRFHVHPRLTRELSRGDFATVHFLRTGADPWVVQVREHDVDLGGAHPR